MWEIAVILGVIIFLVAAYFWLTGDEKKPIQNEFFPGKTIPRYPYKRKRYDIKIGSRHLSTKHPRSSHFLQVRVNTEGTRHEGSCSVCGRSSPLLGNSIQCRHSECSRWYHLKCLQWMKQNKRLQCSCGNKLP